MAVEIVVPDLGESVVGATVAQWLKQEGESVQAGEAVVVLETDKVDLEVAAAQSGVLERIARQKGEDVQVGDVLGTIAAGAAPAAQKAEPQPIEAQQPAAEEAAQPQQKAAEVPAEQTERVTPVARRMAQEKRIDIAQVTGSGPGGRTTKKDVEQYVSQQQRMPEAQQPAAAPAPAPRGGFRADGRAPREERVRMSRRRRTIAQRLVEAQRTAAMLTTFNEINMQGVMELRARRKEAFKERTGVSLGLSSFFIKAAIGALREFPRLNAEIDGDDIVLKHYYDIGVAIGAEEGLIVPVLRDADRMSFAEIERTIRAFVQQSQDKTLSLEDLRGGTFTITNGGVFGSLLSTPILNPPQVGILGLHKIEDRPVALNGQVVIQPMMYVALSYDHRIVDGREAVQFLVRVKELVEDPETLLLEG